MRVLQSVLLGIGTLASGCMSGPPDDAVEGPDTGSATQGITAVDDSFRVFTTDGCGMVEFVDHGEGAPGGGDNDDYAVVHDLCGDGHGVKAWAWLNGTLLGSKYNGNGLAGAAVIWDPFGNVLPGEAIGLKVCLSDGNSDPSPSNCGERTEISSDG
jgi:hypothetical protein